MTDAQILKAVRKELGLTQSEMASKMGYAHQQSISKIEQGKKNLSGPARRCLQLIAEKNGIEKGRHR